MAGLVEAATEAIRSTFCSALEATDRYWNTFLGESLSGFSPFARSAFAYRSFCNREPPQLPDAATGGQCNTVYRITVVYRVFNKVTNTYTITDTITLDRNGKVKGLVERTEVGQRTTYLVTGTFANPDARVEENIISSDATNTDHRGTRITSIVRLDGNPDDCGSRRPPLDSPYPTAPNFSAPITINYNNDFGGNVILGGFVAFGAAYIDADLNLNIPFTLELNADFNIPINGTINLNGGDINFNFGGSNSGGGGGNCKDGTKNWDTDPFPDGGNDDSIDVTPSDPDDENSDVVRVIKGVVTYVTGSSNKVTTVFQDATQDLLVPRCGNVQFLIQVGNTLAWSQDYPVRSNRGLIVCDWPGGAIDVRVTPYAGYTINLQRVYYPIRQIDN